MGLFQSTQKRDEKNQQKSEHDQKLRREQKLRNEINRLKTLSYALDVTSPAQSFYNVMGRNQASKPEMYNILYYEVGIEFLRNHSQTARNIHKHLNGEFLGLKMTEKAKEELKPYQEILRDGGMTYPMFSNELAKIHLLSEFYHDIVKNYGSVTKLSTDDIVEDIFNRDDIEDDDKYPKILTTFKKVRENKEKELLNEPTSDIELEYKKALCKHGEQIEKFLDVQKPNWSPLETTVNYMYSNIKMKGYKAISMQPSSFQYTYEDDWGREKIGRTKKLLYGTFSLDDIPYLVAQMARQIGRLLQYDNNTEEALQIANALINIVESYPTQEQQDKHNDHANHAKELFRSINKDIRKSDNYRDYIGHVHAYEVFITKLKNLDKQIIDMVQMGKEEERAMFDESTFESRRLEYTHFYKYPDDL